MLSMAKGIAIAKIAKLYFANTPRPRTTPSNMNPSVVGRSSNRRTTRNIMGTNATANDVCAPSIRTVQAK